MVSLVFIGLKSRRDDCLEPAAACSRPCAGEHLCPFLLIENRSTHSVRQVEYNGRSLPFDTLDLNAAAMGLDDLFDDAHPQAQSADRCVRCIRPVELVKNPTDLVGIHADPLVFDPDLPSFFSLSAPDNDRLPLGRILHRIGNKISEYLQQTMLITLNPSFFQRAVKDQFNVMLTGKACIVFNRLLGDR